MGETPPPSYEEVVSGEYDRGGSGAAPTVTPEIPPTPARLMPLDFNVYGGTEGPFTPSDLHFMGPHQTDRQFALTIYSNSFAQVPNPFIILHDGLTTRDPAIGTVTNTWTKGQKEFYDRYIITAPPLAGSSSARVQEPLEVARKGTYWHPIINLRYSVQVAAAAAGGISGGNERQEFEWQESSSREVYSLGGDTKGWRLVAVADESETLAVCARNGGSLTKYFRFSFIGKGRAANYYGRTWEVMAVLTGLATWNRRLEIERNMGS
ncbi:hypothetical protein F5Y10DRAFT_244747 [Nemania abortiva]|nr:hypothetical protein F5Y10DRAFT_244747 [Nemania abortiva]